MGSSCVYTEGDVARASAPSRRVRSQEARTTRLTPSPAAPGHFASDSLGYFYSSVARVRVCSDVGLAGSWLLSGGISAFPSLWVQASGRQGRLAQAWAHTSEPPTAAPLLPG